MQNQFANNNFDELFDYVGSVKTIDVPAKQNAKERKQTEVESLLAKGAELAAQHETYKQDIVVRGNKALYELLASVYEFANTVENCAQKDKVVKAMRSELKAQQIKTSTNTPFMTVIVKYIVKAIDRQTAFNYSRVLRVAKAEGVEAKDLASFVANAGGVTKVTKTAAEKEACAVKKSEKNKRVELLRRLYVAQAFQSTDDFDFDKAVMKWRISASETDAKESSNVTGDFAIFLTYYDNLTGKYRIVQAHDFGKPFEDTILNHISKRIKGSTEQIQKAVENLEKKRPVYTTNEIVAKLKQNQSVTC